MIASVEERAKRRLEDFKKLGVEKTGEELMRVIIHGVLHLTGYDDRTAEEKSGMTRRENHYMAKYRK